MPRIRRGALAEGPRCISEEAARFKQVHHARINEAAARYGPRQPRRTKLDTHKPYLLERIAAARPRWIPAVVLLREIREHGYVGGLTQLKAFINPLKQAKIDPVVRFETAPGEQMQADFTVIRRGRDLEKLVLAQAVRCHLENRVLVYGNKTVVFD